MAETPGICTQTTQCELARSGRSVTIPLGEPFVCPECQRGLVPPVQLSPPPVAARVSPALILACTGAGLLVLGGAVFLGHELGAAPAPSVIASLPTPPRAPVQTTAPAKPPAPAPAIVAAVAPPAAAPPPVSAPPAPQLAAAAPVLQIPPPALPAAPAPAQAAGSPPITAAPAPGPVIAAKIASNQPAPAPLPAVQPMPQVVAAPPPPVAPPAVAAVPDQPFSPVPVQGGAPAYPHRTGG